MKVSIIFISAILNFIFLLGQAPVYAVDPPNPINQDNWQVTWTQTADDGIKISSISYKINTVIFDAIIPRIIVKYPSTLTLTDELGGTPAHFEKHDVTSGWYIHATYYIGCTETNWPTPGCYKYIQEWWFYSDGEFRPWLRIYGPGFKDTDGDPTYETRWRIDSDILGSADDGFGYWSSWNYPTIEDKFPSTSPFTPEGYKWIVFDYPNSGGERFAIDPYSPDTPDFWVLRYHAGQTEDDPSVYDNNENIQDPTAGTGQDNVQWYVAFSDYSSCSTTSPCYPGGTWYGLNFP
jgi:hypothetical protein